MKNKNYIFILGSLILFVLISIFYNSPTISGRELIQPDIVHYKGGAKELLDYRNANKTETYWSDSMFGGMPTYQIGAQFSGDVIRYVDQAINFLPKPANYLFVLFSGFFLLGMVVVNRWKYALLGAIFFGFSTYFYIIIAAGHNAKVHTIAYFAPLLAGILLIYFKRKYIWGLCLTALFMALEVNANHPQMTYYLFISIGILILSELVRTIVVKKNQWKHFFISTGVLLFALILGIGMNSQRILANMEYVKETTRGNKILNVQGQSQKSGMDKESITMWSYGKLETFNLMIPRLMGGGSQDKYGEKMMGDIQTLVQENVTSQQELNNILTHFKSPTYWGEQPGTSGPAYQGIVVCFLALLGFFFAPKKYRYWILGSSILTILLAWGSNFEVLTDFFIDYVPMYNKFRAPSSILVVVELLFPLIAMVGLFQFYKKEEHLESYKKKVLIYVSSVVLLGLLIFIIGGKNLLGFNSEEENKLPAFLLDYLRDERFKMFREDAVKALICTAIVASALYFSFIKKISKNWALAIIGIVSFFDLWSVNKSYLNDSNFVDAIFAKNPIQTEDNDYLSDKAKENPFVQGLLSEVTLNKKMEDLTSRDTSHYRIYNNVLGVLNDTNTSYFKSSVGGYSAAKLRRYDDLINYYLVNQNSEKIMNILNLLNVKYLVTGDLGNPIITPNPLANGSAWFVSNIQMVDTPDEEIKVLGTIDNKKTAVVSNQDKKYFEGKNIEKDSTAYLNLENYQPNEMKFSSNSKTPQLAVFSEIYYPHGWNFFIDGKNVPYIKADYLLRAVWVPAGKHEIKMVFEPKVIQQGKILSMIFSGIFVLLILVGIYILIQKRERAVTIKN